MTDQVDLDSLAGEHVLDAVDESVESMKASYGSRFEDCSLIRFRLDGKVYTAIEDPDDGYRSCLGSLILSPDTAMKNVFPPIQVVATKKEPGRYDDDVMQFVDAVTGKVVMEIGTADTGDYYPSFVGYFNPAAMAVNAP
jgi:hypothetical protein